MPPTEDTSRPAAVKEWRLRLHLTEEGRHTRARAVLDTGDQTLESHAEAHRDPDDPSVPAIGDELAAGRALVDLGQRLMRTAAVEIQDLTEG